MQFLKNRRATWTIGLCGLGVAAACFAAAPVLAASPDPSPVVTVSPEGPLSPGDRVEVRWTPLPPGTEEFELLLKVEAPSPLKLRLTESKDPATASITWVVPELPGSSARLVVRRGEEGEETTWAESASLTFLSGGTEENFSPERESSSTVRLRAGELWLQEGGAAARAAVLRASTEVAPGAPGGAPPDSALPASDLSPAPPRDASSPPLSRILLSRSLPSDRFAPASPLRLQLRI